MVLDQRKSNYGGVVALTEPMVPTRWNVESGGTDRGP